MDRVKRMIHMNHTYKSGLNGENVTIAVMDTGITAHPDFGDRIICFKDFYQGKQGLYDDNGHGTHVAGIIAGDGRRSENKLGIRVYSGIAPRANLVIIKVLDKKGNGVTTQVLKGIDWMIQQKEKYKIKAVNISVGMLRTAGIEEQKKLLDAVDEIWDRGIMVITAAGNNGPRENTVTIPGISRKVLTVGCMDDSEVLEEKRLMGHGYSGRGPTDCCIVKPEVLAPGTEIISCGIGSQEYIKKSGTSMAAPVVAGVVALGFQKNPEISPADMKLKIYESVYPRGKQIGRKCWGVIHADNLMAQL